MAQLTKVNIDEAFEWLIVMLGIVSAIMSQYPQYFYFISPHPERPQSLRAAMSIVIPMVITIGLWLIGKLSSRSRVQAMAKVVSWMFILDVTFVNLWSYFLGIILQLLQMPPSSSIYDFIGADRVALINMLQLIGVLLFSSIVTYFVVIPKYRDIYPDISFLKSKTKFLITYGVTTLFLFMLSMSFA